MSLLTHLEDNALSLWGESGGWQHVQRPEPELAGQAPAVLLARSAQLPGNLRYGSIDGREATLLGEVRGDAANACSEEASLNGMEESIAAALDASGFAWKRRESIWGVPANERLPREIQITHLADVVRIAAILVSWDEIGEVEALALGRLLCRAQFGLRFARCELDDRQASIAALVDAAYVERDLPDSLAAVATGSRLLAREVGTLLSPEIARTFVAFLNRGI